MAFAEGSHHLAIFWGTFNTIVLIGSSLTMALAVHAIQMGKRKKMQIFLFLTLILGSIFLGVKAIEYWHKFHEHLVPGPHFSEEIPREIQVFFSFYFAMTGMHALHMIMGIVALIVFLVKGAKGRYTSEYYTPVEMMGLYWHFVDLVWVFIFAFFYLW